MLKKCCSARISVGAMNATCRPFSIATSAAISATMVLPAPTSPCSRRFIGCGRCMSVDDLRECRLLIARQLERQHAPDGLPVLVGDDDGARLALGVRAAPPQHDAELEEEELFEDQPAVRGRTKRVQLVDRRVGRREMDLLAAPPPIHQLLSLADGAPAADRAAGAAAAAAPDARACAASSR